VRKNKYPFPSALLPSGVASIMAISFRVDFCLVRNEVYRPSADYRNILFGLMFGNVPSVNSLQSIYMFLERPIVQGGEFISVHPTVFQSHLIKWFPAFLHSLSLAQSIDLIYHPFFYPPLCAHSNSTPFIPFRDTSALNRVANEIGREMFPVVDQSYYCNHQALMYGNTFPAVVKVGAAHAGVGKMKVANHHDMEDFRSIMAMTHGNYCTAEPFLNGEFDLRIQKIGSHYRLVAKLKCEQVTNAWCIFVSDGQLGFAQFSSLH
jgi:hypothetical protein